MERQQANGSFLFSTNNATGMQLNNLPEEEKINDTKWNTLKFPENCKMIKKIICGAEFVVIFNDLIIQLNNDDLMICRRNVTKPAVTKIFNECGIKSIFCGPLTRNFIVVDKKNKVYEMTSKFEQKEIDTSELYNNNSNNIKFIGCSNQAYLLVTSDNKIYGYGSSLFGELGSLQSTLNKFQYMSTPFEKESEIIDLKGGYYHFVVLLKSGIVYAIGYNNIGAVNIYNQNDFNYFTKLTHPLFENEFINRIVCSSRGTVLITKSNNVYFIGEVVNALQGYDHCNDNRINSGGNSIDKNIQSYKVNGRTIQRVKLSDEYNDVVAGGWHYIIYNNYNLNKSKSLLYFEKRLLDLMKEQHNNDISIVTVL
ncbi:hypothetical protein ABK040_008538 [Willaertia magna]